ncbi:MAG: arylesterase [Pseudomonadota bacterium]
MKSRTRKFLPIITSIGLLFAAACGSADPGLIDAPEPAASTHDTDTEENPDELTSIAPQGDAYTIVMLGDSLTAGFGLPQARALPEQLERLLEPEYPNVNLVNAGVSGDTSAGGLARYDWSVASAQPDLLVIALGANDYLSGLDPAQTRDNLAEIIERGLADEVAVLLVSLSARSTAADDPRAATFANIYPELAQAYDVALYEGLVDPIYNKPELLMPDGLHPTAAGVEVIAAPLAEAITPLLSAD